MLIPNFPKSQFSPTPNLSWRGRASDHARQVRVYGQDKRGGVRNQLRFFLILFFFFSTAQAQIYVSRADLMRLAERSASVEVARARLNAAETQAQAVGLGLSGSASSLIGVSGVMPTTGDTVLSYPWSLQLNLKFAGIGGQAVETRVQAGLNLEQARRALAAARLRALSQAITLWHNLRRGFVALEVAQMAVGLAQLEDSAAETRLQSGAISSAERERVALALESAKLDVSRAELGFSSARWQIEALYGIRGALAVSDWQALPEPTTIQLEAREDVFEVRAAVILANVQRQTSQAALAPTLNLETSWRGSAGALTVSTNQFLALNLNYSYPASLPFGVSSSFGLALSLSLPIQPLGFSSLASQNQVLGAAQSSLEVTLALAKTEVENKRVALVLAGSALSLVLRSAEFAKQQLARVQTRFDAGSVSILEFKRAQVDNLKAALQVFEAQGNVDTAMLELYSAVAFSMEVK